MMEEDLTKEGAQLDSQAAARASVRAKTSRWNLETAMLLFAVLFLTLMLLFEGIATEIVAPVALLGLVLAWLVGWRYGKQLYARFYIEELSTTTDTAV